jgi:hypothetical protein
MCVCVILLLLLLLLLLLQCPVPIGLPLLKKETPTPKTAYLQNSHVSQIKACKLQVVKKVNINTAVQKAKKAKLQLRMN